MFLAPCSPESAVAGHPAVEEHWPAGRGGARDCSCVLEGGTRTCSRLHPSFQLQHQLPVRNSVTHLPDSALSKVSEYEAWSQHPDPGAWPQRFVFFLQKAVQFHQTCLSCIQVAQLHLGCTAAPNTWKHVVTALTAFLQCKI